MEQKKEMNVYVYVLIMTSITALILSFLYTFLDPMLVTNKANAKESAILTCIPDSTLNLNDPAAVKTAYAKVTMYAVKEDGTVYTKDNLDEINKMASGGAQQYKTLAELDLGNEEKKPKKDRLYPVYEYDGPSGKIYVVAIRGNGLWDKIWGYIALGADLNTIQGVYFDHKGETPGLGAEIKDSPAFKKQFIGLKVFDKNSKVAVTVLKREKEGEHYATGISGATITCDGVSKMFASGMVNYQAYFATLGKK